jgi:hypothetical protein
MNRVFGAALYQQINPQAGRAIPQAISSWLPTAEARVRARVWSSGICGGQSGAGAGFLRALQFPLPIFTPPNSLSSQSPRTGTIAQKWPACRVDPVRTPPPTMKIKKKSVMPRIHEGVEFSSVPTASKF